MKLFKQLCCWKLGHHWSCDRMLYNGTIATKFYHWTCLTCSKQQITELRDWDIVTAKDQNELALAKPK